MTKEKGAKIGYLELLRTIACFFVIVNHTVSGIFLSGVPEMRTWWVSVAYFFVSKTAVPVFLMISGALLLGKVEKAQKHSKRIMRIIMDIVLFSLLFYIYGSYRAGTPVDIIEYFKQVGKKHFTNAYWYLYLYLGILVMLPLLQRLSVNMSKNAYRYLILISVVFLGGMPILTHYFAGASVHSLLGEPFFSVYVGIFFLGYYLSHEVEIRNSYALISAFVFVIMIGLQVYATYWEYRQNPEDYLFYDERTLLTVTTTAAALFYLARWFEHVVHCVWFWKCIAFLGGCSFGVYLFSDLFIDFYGMSYLELMMRMHVLKAVVLYQLEVFVSGVVVTVVLKQIPGIKKLL